MDSTTSFESLRGLQATVVLDRSLLNYRQDPQTSEVSFRASIDLVCFIGCIRVVSCLPRGLFTGSPYNVTIVW